MHVLALFAVIIAIGLGLIHRPATVIFLGALIFGFVYLLYLGNQYPG
jgi:NADH:ubiquinone oxidoreductase subunit 3 (subunit A)